MLHLIAIDALNDAAKARAGVAMGEVKMLGLGTTTTSTTTTTTTTISSSPRVGID